MKTPSDEAWEMSRKRGPFRRLTLRRGDGRVYLDRWGIRLPGVGAVLVHRMEAPDPGIDLHDHPWWFVSIVLWGGYVELRTDTRVAPIMAEMAQMYDTCHSGNAVVRRPGSIRSMRLDECHTIVHLMRRTSWSLVITGPVRRKWGFYLPNGYMTEHEYDRTVRAERRDLWSDQKAKPW